VGLQPDRASLEPYRFEREGPGLPGGGGPPNNAVREVGELPPVTGEDQAVYRFAPDLVERFTWIMFSPARSS